MSRSLERVNQRKAAPVNLAHVQDLFLNYQRSMGRSDKNIAHYCDSFRLMELYHPSPEMTSQTFQGLVAYLQRTPTRGFRGSTVRTPAGIHGVMKDWRAFCRWAYSEGHLDTLPKVPVPKIPQTLFPILDEDDLQTIFNCRQCDPKTEIGKRNRALVSFMLDTGVRLSEVSTLVLRDVDIKEGTAKVLGKGSKERLVFFSAGVSDALKRWLMVRGDEDGSLFWLAPSGVRQVLERIKKETGLSLLHAHQIRHTAATMMVRNQADLHTVKRILGHSQLSTVEVYLSLDSRDLQSKHAAASPFDKIRGSLNGETGRRRLKA